ncbi:unnamed protein product [Menidia menidia]|uniref:(Atlantic silverside) hypothetical protein n=1 Tax=Menidia menidia TaxID=238744 RepID=A0A8S4B3F5_9TELE|nr:unnamed protein product [Menidia menidia]
MDQLCAGRLKMLLIVSLLMSTNNTRLRGDSTTGKDVCIHCVNNYLFTVDCSLNMTPSENAPFGDGAFLLVFTEVFEKKTFVCELKNTTEGYFCSTTAEPNDDQDTFTDLDSYEISLCHRIDEGPETCELLVEEYTPEKHIKPNTPCGLTVNHSSSQHLFFWRSTYEEYSNFNKLMENLQYQLQFYKTADKHKVVVYDIKTDSKKYSVGDERFEPDTEYAARVRSSPNMAHYMGQWSDWSPEASWRTEAAVKGAPTNLLAFEVCVVFAVLCVVAILVSLFCYVSVKKWRQITFIPTPAPYFHTLYTDCQGDFKSWVVTQESAAGILKVEETLRINTLMECVDVPEDARSPVSLQLPMEGRAYRNVPGPLCGAHVQDPRHTDGSVGLPAAPGSSVETFPLCSPTGSLAPDSGCWLGGSSSSLEEPRWYCNEYCTLSCFQQAGSGAAHLQSLESERCQIGIIDGEAEA